MEYETELMFDDFNNFETSLEQIFGNTDEEREAERQLKKLRQTGSAAQYTAKFRQLMVRVPWNTAGFMSQYFEGLKREVQKELYKEDRPDDFTTFTTSAIRIDNSQYR